MITGVQSPWLLYHNLLLPPSLQTAIPEIHLHVAGTFSNQQTTMLQIGEIILGEFDPLAFFPTGQLKMTQLFTQATADLAFFPRRSGQLEMTFNCSLRPRMALSGMVMFYHIQTSRCNIHHG